MDDAEPSVELTQVLNNFLIFPYSIGNIPGFQKESS